MVEFVRYAEEKLRLLKGEEEKKAAQEHGNFKRIETQAEGLEYSSAFSYKERSRIDYPLIVDDIFSCLGDFCFQEKVEQEIKANVKAGLSYVEYNMQSKNGPSKIWSTAKHILGRI